MRLWFEIARRGYRRSAAYRGAVLAGLFTNVMFGFMRAYILLALFSENATVAGYDERDTVTYAWFTQGLLIVAMVWGETELAEKIRSGDVVTDLYRPVDLQAYHAAYSFGRAAHLLLYRGTLPVVIGALTFGIVLPRPAVWPLFVLSVALVVALASQIRYLLNMSAFWLLDHRGVFSIASTFIMALSGFIVPVAFFPQWAEDLARVLPFASLLQTPLDVFLDKPEAAQGLALQAIWLVILAAAGYATTRRARIKVVIQGG